jgi:hypothetical protein
MDPMLDGPRDGLDCLHREITLLARLPHVVDELLAVEFLAPAIPLDNLQAQRDALVGAESLAAGRALAPPPNALTRLDVPRVHNARVIVSAERALHQRSLQTFP